MQGRDKKYNQNADTGALWGNHLADVQFGQTLGIKSGKLAFADDDDDDDDKNNKTEPDKKIRKLNSDINEKAKKIRDLEHRLEIQEEANDDLRAELDLAKKDQETMESLQKREAEYTRIGKELREKGLETPAGKKLLDKFIESGA